jgi:hypothetical protein
MCFHVNHPFLGVIPGSHFARPQRQALMRLRGE